MGLRRTALHMATAMRTMSLLFTLLAFPGAASAQVKVLISGGFSGAYEKLLPEFERSSGIKVTTGSGASQGDGPQTIKAQLARGVPADVVVLSREGLNDLIAANKIASGTDKDLAKVGLGVAVPAQSPKPDMSTVVAVKQTLLNAKLIAMPGSTGGIWLMKDLFPRLGIAEKVKLKLTARGTEATSMVAAKEADLAVMPISEILHASGVDFAGALPADIQFLQTFSAAVVAGSTEAEGAKRLIQFLASPGAAPALKGSGLEPLASLK
jgi:molybdate transport system substrate-binding protein